MHSINFKKTFEKWSVSNPKSSEKILRYSLGMLLVLVLINAFAGGYYGLVGARNIPTEWLKGSPFRNYFIPSLFLFFGVGGSALFAAIALFRRKGIAHKASLTCGIIILLWITIQVAIIGYISWMQPTTALSAIIIIFLTWQLSKHP